MIRRIADSSMELQDVSYLVEDGKNWLVSSVELIFDPPYRIVFEATEDDAIRARVGSLEVHNHEEMVTASDQMPWRECLGKGVIFAWELLNSGGYTDGVQFLFGRNVTDTHCIQLMVEASSFTIGEVNNFNRIDQGELGAKK